MKARNCIAPALLGSVNLGSTSIHKDGAQALGPRATRGDITSGMITHTTSGINRSTEFFKAYDASASGRSFYRKY